MPLVLDPDEARRFHDQNKGPGSFLDLLATAGYRAAGVGLRLGLFAALQAADQDEPMSAQALADALDTDPRGTELLADLLVSFGYLHRRKDGGYTNTALTNTWLGQSSNYSMVEQFWNQVLFDLWDNLEQAVRTGTPPMHFYEWLSQRPETLARFQSMLAAHATQLAEEVAAALTPPAGDCSLLDIGGGHARYTVALCARHPGLRATVLDVPDALAVGAKAVAEAALADRVTLRPGDYHTDELGSHDIVLLFNLLHGHDITTNHALLHRVAAALRPGGTAVILEHGAEPPADAGTTEAAYLRMFSLNLFLGQGGQVYRVRDITSWLTDAGLTHVTTRPLAPSPLERLVIARKPT